MPPALGPAPRRWCDVDGNHIALFCWVEQVMEDREPGVLPSRLHQRGQVLGRGPHSLYVSFSGNVMVGLSAEHLRLLPGQQGEY